MARAGGVWIAKVITVRAVEIFVAHAQSLAVALPIARAGHRGVTVFGTVGAKVACCTLAVSIQRACSLTVARRHIVAKDLTVLTIVVCSAITQAGGSVAAPIA